MTSAIHRGLRFNVINLGSVRRGSFTQRPLTVFCGPNNAGKTWVMYALFHFISSLRRLPVEEESAPLELAELNRGISGSLHTLFNGEVERFEDAKFNLAEGKGWDELASSPKARPDVFLMPAERNGLHLFFRELSTRRTALLHHASRPNIDISELLRDVIRSRYATPIAHYIDWLNNLTELRKLGPSDFHSMAEYLKRGLVKGAYRVQPDSGEIVFRPYRTKRDGKMTKPMELHLTSGSVKSLFGLWFYLRHQAELGDVLMLDEPELNVHPENQRKIARFLARLVNLGLNVTISTHSDYIVREFNTLIMLSNEGADDLRKKHGYRQEEVLAPSIVGAYLFDQQTITPFEITSEDGIYATTFDSVIENLNDINNDIFYTLQEGAEG